MKQHEVDKLRETRSNSVLLLQKLYLIRMFAIGLVMLDSTNSRRLPETRPSCEVFVLLEQVSDFNASVTGPVIGK
jgi:hypothetical protein